MSNKFCQFDCERQVRLISGDKLLKSDSSSELSNLSSDFVLFAFKVFEEDTSFYDNILRRLYQCKHHGQCHEIFSSPTELIEHLKSHELENSTVQVP